MRLASKPGTNSTKPADTAPPEGARTGKACFFSSSPGGRTAVGAGVDHSSYVGAHATYPLGSRVTVTNLANGKAVEARIVDRLPDARRIISVSEATAKVLGFYDAGIADDLVDAMR